MSKMLWNAFRLTPGLLGAVILMANGAIAADAPALERTQEETTAEAPQVTEQAIASVPVSQLDSIPAPGTQLAQLTPIDLPPVTENAQPNRTLEQVNQYAQDLNSVSVNAMDQVTSVAQLRDVQPTDWAYQALQSLVERYGCIEGYPDRTYRGNRAMTRYEFAAGLNACLNVVNELIAAAIAELQGRDDIAIIRRLQEEFAAELATLRGRVDALDARVAEVEANQFSTTTKLNGEVIFAVAGAFGDNIAVPSGRRQVDDDVEDNVIFANRSRLNFDTSFTGRDLLRTRLQARNITPFGGNVTGTNMTRLGFDGNEENDLRLDDLYYRFPIGRNTRISLVANSGESNDFMFNFNPILESSSNGVISRFGRFNPIYRLGDGGAGAFINTTFGPIGLDVGYLAVNANLPFAKAGLADGEYAAIGQLTLFPRSSFNLGLTYANYYSPSTGGVNLTGSTGSGFAQRPFGRVATSSDNYGLQATWRAGRSFLLSGWAGLSYATAESGASRGADARILNYAVTLGFPDFGGRGNLLGLVAGVPPKVIDNDLVAREDRDTSYHLEGFFRFLITNNISVTPGVMVILNPEHNDNNDTLYIGTIRTTFRF